MTECLRATELAEYLRALRDADVMSANVDLGAVKFAVVFAPESAPAQAAVPEPGGWKSPQHLDVLEIDQPRVTPDSSIP